MVYLVSDGGEDNGLGYYGWVIATKDDIIVEHKGHAYGNKRLIKFLRTESIGVLSIAYFIHQFCKFYEIRIGNKVCIYYCDNKTVVERINFYNKGTILNTSQTLSPDYDLQAQIETTLKEIKVHN